MPVPVRPSSKGQYTQWTRREGAESLALGQPKVWTKCEGAPRCSVGGAPGPPGPQEFRARALGPRSQEAALPWVPSRSEHKATPCGHREAPWLLYVKTAGSGRRLSLGSWPGPTGWVRAQGPRMHAGHFVGIEFYILSDQIYKMKNRFTKTCPKTMQEMRYRTQREAPPPPPELHS